MELSIYDNAKISLDNVMKRYSQKTKEYKNGKITLPEYEIEKKYFQLKYVEYNSIVFLYEMNYF